MSPSSKFKVPLTVAFQAALNHLESLDTSPVGATASCATPAAASSLGPSEVLFLPHWERIGLLLPGTKTPLSTLAVQPPQWLKRSLGTGSKTSSEYLPLPRSPS